MQHTLTHKTLWLIAVCWLSEFNLARPSVGNVSQRWNINTLIRCRHGIIIRLCQIFVIIETRVDKPTHSTASKLSFKAFSYLVQLICKVPECPHAHSPSLSCHFSDVVPYWSTLASSSVWPRWWRQLHYTHSNHQAPFFFLYLVVQFDSCPNLLSNYANEFIVGGSPSWLSRDSDSLGTGGQKVCSAHVWQFDRLSTEREQGRRERKNFSLNGERGNETNFSVSGIVQKSSKLLGSHDSFKTHKKSSLFIVYDVTVKITPSPFTRKSLTCCHPAGKDVMNTINKVIRVTHSLLSDETQAIKHLIGGPGNNNKTLLNYK